MRIGDMPRRVQAVLLAGSDAERNELSALLDDYEWRLLSAFFEDVEAMRRGEPPEHEGTLL